MSTQGLINEFSRLLGKEPIRLPKRIKTRVDESALRRIRNQLQKDREKGLIK